jgi:hypothetical protein
MKDAPALVQAAGLTCTVADARLIAAGDKDHPSFYEVACQDGAGYVLAAKPKAPTPDVYSCVIFAGPGPDGKKSNIECELPGNANPAAGLKSVLAKAGPACVPDKARYVGSSSGVDVFEVSCAGLPGYILQVPKSGPPTAVNCISQTGDNDIKCTLTPPEQQTAYLGSLASGADASCTVKDRRYVGSTADNNDFYEIACASGKGYMLQTSPDGKLVKASNCISAVAASIGGGCTLADYRQAMTQQNGLYSSLAKKAGFDCDVSRYADFPDATNPEIVELACSNRPDGGVGVFPTTGPGHVHDCIRSEAEGYKCSFTPEAADYPALTAQLKAKGKGSCVVSGARPVGQTAEKADLIEVACADGGPGWVLVYDANASLPNELLNCQQAASTAGSGCQLPTNKKS